jgi:hypothetical protein
MRRFNFVKKVNGNCVTITAFTFFFAVIFTTLNILSFSKDDSNSYTLLNRTWGFDHITYFPALIVVIYFLIVAALILPFSNSRIILSLAQLPKLILRFKISKRQLFLFLSLVSVVLFYMLKVKYFFLGDFNLRMEQTMRKEFVNTEYMTMLLLYYFTKAGGNLGFTHQQMFVLYSCLTGGVFVYLSLLIADTAGENIFEKTMFFISQLSGGVVLVFAGYIEIYATPVLLLSLFIYGGLQYLKNKVQYLVPLLYLAMALASHLIALFAMPALLVIWYHRNKNKLNFIAQSSNIKIAITVATLIVIGMLIAFNSRHIFVIPFSSAGANNGSLSFLSCKHFWELLNGQILSAGLSFFVISVLLIKVFVVKITLQSNIYFLLTIAGGFLLFILIANLQRGSGDWDLMAFTSVPVNLLLFFLITDLYRERSRIRNYLFTCIAGINLLFTLLWLLLNHTDLSIYKVKDMLKNDPASYYTSRITGLYQLAILYELNNLNQEAQQVMLQICNSDSPDNNRACVARGRYLAKTNRHEEARLFYIELIKERPLIPEAYVFLLEHFNKKGEKEQFMYYLELLFENMYNQPDSFFKSPHIKNKIYLELFEFLYQETLKNGDQEKLDKINLLINGLQKL